MRVINYVETFSYNSYIPAHCTKEETSNIYYRIKRVSLYGNMSESRLEQHRHAQWFDVNEVKLEMVKRASS